MLHALVLFAGLEGRTVRYKQKLCAGFFETFDSIWEPYVFADGRAYFNAFEIDRPLQITGFKDSDFVKDPVIGQKVLCSNSADFALFQQKNCVVQFAF